MDGDEIRVPSPTAYYLAHLISALDRIRAREADHAPPMPPSGSSANGLGWGEPADAAVIYPGPAAAAWIVPMSV